MRSASGVPVRRRTGSEGEVHEPPRPRFALGEAPDRFRMASDLSPCGDQPQAIETLVRGLGEGRAHQVLLGVTGSGKTFTIAKVIEAVNRPTLVLAHNKTLAAQLYQEFRRLFPENAVEYFVSYYDYYQPEAYVPRTDTFIEKEATINDEIDRMRHSATRSLFERRDVIVVASVSCIYGLGSPEAYYGMLVFLEQGARVDRDELLRNLVRIQYQRNDQAFERGTFRVRGDVIEVFPSYEDLAVRIELWGDEIERLSVVDPLRGTVLKSLKRLPIYPRTHYVTPKDRLDRAVEAIKAELGERLAELEGSGRRLEAQRLHQRSMFDLEMLKETGYCRGIENYSRHLTGRAVGEPPPTLMDYLATDALVIVDESHVSLTQLGGMYKGDRSRKETLVEHGFRLPSALDNRPLTFAEWEGRVAQVIYVSATPAPYELGRSGGEFVEQIIRPTGLVDPEIAVRPVAGQVDDLLAEIRAAVSCGERVFVTTLTKRMAEDLSEYYRDVGVKVRYLHSDIDTLERVEILRDLRRGTFDVLVGINLLREGLDVPEVALVAVLDADKEGFLRSSRSLIQTIGRAARNVKGRVILYADTITHSMREAREETERRRNKQKRYNQEHGITPRSVVRAIDDALAEMGERDYLEIPVPDPAPEDERLSVEDLESRIRELSVLMREAAAALEFEKAAQIRDRIQKLRRATLLA